MKITIDSVNWKPWAIKVATAINSYYDSGSTIRRAFVGADADIQRLEEYWEINSENARMELSPGELRSLNRIIQKRANPSTMSGGTHTVTGTSTKEKNSDTVFRKLAEALRDEFASIVPPTAAAAAASAQRRHPEFAPAPGVLDSHVPTASSVPTSSVIDSLSTLTRTSPIGRRERNDAAEFGTSTQGPGSVPMTSGECRLKRLEALTLNKFVYVEETKQSAARYGAAKIGLFILAKMYRAGDIPATEIPDTVEVLLKNWAPVFYCEVAPPQNADEEWRGDGNYTIVIRSQNPTRNLYVAEALGRVFGTLGIPWNVEHTLPPFVKAYALSPHGKEQGVNINLDAAVRLCLNVHRNEVALMKLLGTIFFPCDVLSWFGIDDGRVPIILSALTSGAGAVQTLPREEQAIVEKVGKFYTDKARVMRAGAEKRMRGVTVYGHPQQAPRLALRDAAAATGTNSAAPTGWAAAGPGQGNPALFGSGHTPRSQQQAGSSSASSSGGHTTKFWQLYNGGGGPG